MGRTVPTYRMHLEAILAEWLDYRRALRERDRLLFDEVISKARQHSSAASYCAHIDPVETAFLSILLELEREVKALKERLARLQAGHDAEESPPGVSAGQGAGLAESPKP